MNTITPFRMSREGRVLIPAPIRKQLHFEPGSELVGRIEDGRLILESRANVLRRLQDRLAHLPSDLMLSEDLIADRREEAGREEASEIERESGARDPLQG